MLTAALACASLSGAPSRADEGAEAARRAAIVARIGERAITVGYLEDRIAQVPGYQRPTFGDDARAVRRAFLERAIVSDQLLVEAAKSEGLDKRAPASFRVSRALANAELRRIRSTAETADSISKEDVRAYYDAHRSLYDAPERVLVHRILCATRGEAEAVLAKLKADPRPEAFTELARAQSIDKATHLRGGSLGFLADDGTSHEAGLRADPVLVAAARSVKDGELVPTPVAEGPHFAVVARRGTSPARRRSLEDATPQIRELIARERFDTRVNDRVKALEARLLRESHPDLVARIELPPPSFDAITVGDAGR